MEERARLSRERHDGLAQLVTFVLVRLDTVSDLVRADRRAEAEAELEHLRHVADDLYLDVREAIADCGAASSSEAGAALRDYVDQFEERRGVPVERIP